MWATVSVSCGFGVSECVWECVGIRVGVKLTVRVLVSMCVCVRFLGQDWLAQCRGVQMESNRVRRTVPLQAVGC